MLYGPPSISGPLTRDSQGWTVLDNASSDHEDTASGAAGCFLDPHVICESSLRIRLVTAHLTTLAWSSNIDLASDRGRRRWRSW
jgi:hypothetical protein